MKVLFVVLCFNEVENTKKLKADFFPTREVIEQISFIADDIFRRYGTQGEYYT